MLPLNTNLQGHLVQVNQRMDYMFRPEELKDVSLYTFACEYDKVRGQVATSQESEETDSDADTYQQAPAHAGRPKMPRFNFQDKHPQADTHCLRYRGDTINTQHIPVLKGMCVPSRNNADKHDLYSAMMLILLKPWRSAEELLNGADTWEAAFTSWAASLSPQSQAAKQMERFELLHVCAEEKEQDKQRMMENVKRLMARDDSGPTNQTDTARTRTADECSDTAMDIDAEQNADIQDIVQALPEVRHNFLRCGAMNKVVHRGVRTTLMRIVMSHMYAGNGARPTVNCRDGYARTKSMEYRASTETPAINTRVFAIVTGAR